MQCRTPPFRQPPKACQRLTAVASTAAGASIVAFPATAATPAETAEPIAPVANPELVALLGDLKAAKDELAWAEDAMEWLFDEWRHRWPLTPDEITLRGFREKHGDSEVDLQGRPVMRPGEQYARRLYSLEDLAWHVDYMARRVKKARTAKTLAFALKALAKIKHDLRLGQEYYREIERIKEASGLRAAKARVEAAKGEIYRLGEAIMAMPPSSIACLTVKAEAVELWFDTMFPLMRGQTTFVAWPILMARDIRDVALGGVS